MAEIAKGYPTFNGIYSQEHSAAVAGTHPKYVPGCPHKMGNFGLSGYFWWRGLHMPIAFWSCPKPADSQDHKLSRLVAGQHRYFREKPQIDILPASAEEAETIDGGYDNRLSHFAETR